MDKLRRTYETRVPAHSLIKSELRNNSGDRSSIPAPAAMPRSNIELLYAAEEDNQEVVPEDAIGQPGAEAQWQNRRETPGEAWIRTWDQPQWFGLGTEEALERWSSIRSKLRTASSEATQKERKPATEGRGRTQHRRSGRWWRATKERYTTP